MGIQGKVADCKHCKVGESCLNFCSGDCKIIEQNELEIIKQKAKKWDELEAEIAKCYFDDDGNELTEEESENIDLGTIGEIAAMKLGFL